MTYEFGATLHRNSREFHQHIAEEFLSAGGLNNHEAMLGFLRNDSNNDLAAEAESEWQLTENPDYDHEELLDAFAHIRANFNCHFPQD